MEDEKDIREQEEQLTPAQNVSSDWKALVDKVSYRGIVNNVPYMAFLVLLCVLYITNNQRTIETQRELNRKNDHLKELRWKYMDIKSQIMNAGMETQVIRNAAAHGLKPIMLPAYKIEIDSNKTVSN
jgi:cell division protein FtsL